MSGKGVTVAIIGGGVAGLAAAVAAVQRGLQVELFEARRRLGGRAGSFFDAQAGQWIDLGQHVAMGCCTTLADLFRRTGIDAFQRHRTYHFIAPDGRRHDFTARRWLPAPLHLLPGLLGLGYLSLRDRLRIGPAMLRLARLPDTAGDQAIGPWLRAQGQSVEAIERFWSVVLVSALGETIDRASLSAARKVFGDGFLASRSAYELLLPNAPLGELYDGGIGRWLATRGAAIHRACRVRKIEGDASRVRSVLLADGSRRTFDFVILAVPWRAVRGLLCDDLFTAMPSLDSLHCFEPSSITTLHLWFDRPIMPLPHAALVGRLSHWVFRKPPGPNGHPYQMVISASRGLQGRDRQAVLADVRADLEAIWPAARSAELLRWRIVTEREAVFSCRPGLDAHRPTQRTPIPNLLLAGDWTATGWPATMEGAARSGYAAVEEIIRR